MSSFLRAITNKAVIALLIISAILLISSGRRALISLGDPVSFDEILDGKKLEEGDYVNGEVLYTFGQYASEDKVDSKTNRVIESNVKVYYVIPTNDEFVFYGLEVNKDTYKSLDKNADQTYEYVMNGAAAPTTCPKIEGWVTTMDDELEKYWVEWLEEYGYTKAEIKDRGECLYIKQFNSTSDKVVSLIGLILLAIAIIVIVLIMSKDKRRKQMASQSMMTSNMGNNFYGNDPYAANNTYVDPYAANNTNVDPYAANNTYIGQDMNNNGYGETYTSVNNNNFQ